jgi:hypothetical protein
MKNKNSSPTIIPQSNRNSKNENHSYQLSLPLALDRNQQKPQIVSIPGISPKQRDRYRVMRGDQVLGDRLTLDEAIALANQSTHL